MSKRCQTALRGLSVISTLLLSVVTLASHVSGNGVDPTLTNQFLVKLHKRHSNEEAQALGKGMGFDFLHRHLNSDDKFIFTHPDLPKIHSDRAVDHENKLVAHPMVDWAKQAEGYPRHKRNAHTKSRRESGKYFKKAIPGSEPVRATNDYPEPNDELFAKEWYIKNTGQAGGIPGLDLNVQAAWQAGFTGEGITTAIMDDGIDYLHPDLAENFNANSSYDFSSGDPYPYPRYTDDWFNSHGTRCAGEISAKANNHICGVGVAFKSKVAGLRILDQPYMTDLIEANAMSFHPNETHIYSASWGPTDDGRTLDGPRNETLRAMVDGINYGRKGKGSIFVWASGDGGAKDDCNCDGYAASMWTISINSATNDGQTASYDESCSSTLASTFSNGKMTNSPDAGVATVDLYSECTLRHSGTSAAAPQAAAVFALALQANPNLTWRDLQHIIVLTSKRNHLHDPTGIHNWTINGAGLEFNHLFGFGVLDAGDLAKTSKDWITVPERYHCVAAVSKRIRYFNVSRAIDFDFSTDACVGQSNEVNFLEHVQIFISMKATRRGDITAFLISPSGTQSLILGKRPLDDDSKSGFVRWPFMSTQMWAERPAGKWRLHIALKSDDPVVVGRVEYVELVMHGTKEEPYKNQPLKMLSYLPKLGVVKRMHKKTK